MRPNVLLLVADQWRGDCLGVDGHPNVKTPFLDTLANEGVRFDHAYSATPSCCPARCALFTGMTQEHHGRVGYQDRVRWQYENTLAGCFTKAGYQTQCVGKMHVWPLRARMGFENVRLHDGFLHTVQKDDTPACEYQLIADDYMYEMQGRGHRDLLSHGIECNGWATRPWMYEEETHPTQWVADNCLDFLRSRDRDCPFFLMASFVRPHSPLDPPESYMAKYRGKSMKQPPMGDWASPPSRLHHNAFDGMADPEQREEAQRAYYALIEQIDHQIGRILEVLMTNGDLDNTIVLFVTDHGDMMGDHGLYRKSLPYEGSARIPLIVYGCGIEKGRVDHHVAEIRDVMPTLLRAAGLEVPDTVDGIDLLHDREALEKRGWIHGEHPNGALTNHFIVTDHDKYIWFSTTGEEQYFDLSVDKEETHNAIHDAAYQQRIRELRRTLTDVLKDREEGYVVNGTLTPIKHQPSILGFLQKYV